MQAAEDKSNHLNRVKVSCSKQVGFLVGDDRKATRNGDKKDEH